MYGDFGRSRAHWRQGHIPTPTSQATTLEMLEGCKEHLSDEDPDPDNPSDVEAEMELE